MYDETHVACLESLKDEFGLLTSATTAPELLKCFLNALYVREVVVLPLNLGLEMSRFWVENPAWKRRKNMSFFLAKPYGPGLKSRLR